METPNIQSDKTLEINPLKMSNFTYEIFNEADILARCGDDVDTNCDGTTQTLLMVQPKAMKAVGQFKKMTRRYSNFGDNYHGGGRWWGWSQYWKNGECHMCGWGRRFWMGYGYYFNDRGGELTVEAATSRAPAGISREAAVEMFGEHSVLRAEHDVRAIWQWKNCGTKKGGIPYIKLVPPGFMEMLRYEWNIDLQVISRQQAVELVGEEVTANCEQLCYDLYVEAPRQWLRDTTFGSYPLPQTGE